MSLLSSVALAQINVTVGDIGGNVEKILDAWKQAAARGAQLVVCPELCIVGYPPEDLILSPDFRARAVAAVHALAVATKDGPALLVGGVWEEYGQAFNAAFLLEHGGIAHIHHKARLPNYGVFDEKRLFSAGEGPRVAQWRGHTLGILVCEDVWDMSLAEQLKYQGAELLIAINASPFEAGKMEQRLAMARDAVRASGTPLVYVNLVGGQDDIVFDGGSFVMSAAGEIVTQAECFAEAVITAQDPALPLRSPQENLWNAMALGLQDYVRKNGFSGVLLGLSGGIDSAVSAAVAVDALGAAQVEGVLLPSPYTSRDSVEDALETARLLGIRTRTIPITPGMETFSAVLSPEFGAGGWMEDPAVGGNLQARLRGITLMALSNRFGGLLLSTGNKSEIAVGYTTLYGDACGSYNVLKDVYKTQVYALAHWRNAQGAAIPARSIEKPPSAELKPGQRDDDQLPPYDVLDAILALHIEGAQAADAIVAQGFERAVVEKVIMLVRRNEYKRRQSCPGVKLSPMLFGKDRRYPLTSGY